MKIKSIEMSYFFRIYQSNKVEFSTDEKRNVTVIKGDNGTGKTTILSAFSWVFYGVVEDPLTIDKMLNKRRLYEMKVGDTERSGVKVVISDNDHDYMITRYQQFKKIEENKSVKIGEPDYSVIDMANPAEVISDKSFFERMIPKDLKGFFFFDGERIDRLAKIDGRSEIRQAILDILGLTTLERIADAVNELQSDYNKKIKSVSKNEVLKQLRQDYEDLETEIAVHKAKLEGDGTPEKPGIEARLKTVENQVDVCTRFLKEHNAEAVKALALRREQLTSEKERITAEQLRIRSEVLHHISKNFKYYLLSDRFTEIADFLEEKRKKKELPSDIKAQFVKDLLASGECICGQKLVEGECFHTNILKLLETAGREELDNAYITMKAFVESNEINHAANSFFEVVNSYSRQTLDCSTQMEEIDKELQEIKKKMSGNFGEMIAKHEEMLEQATKLRDELRQDRAYHSRTIKADEEKKIALSKKIMIEEARQGDKDMFSVAFNMAGEVGQLNKEIRELFIDITREDMDEKIKGVFANISRKDDREACLNDNFELTIRNKVSHEVQILSTGERQITSLSFIGALVSYSKEKTKSDLITDFSGGDFPIVMDSAFGNLDPTHKANVAKGLPLLASQVIVIISDEQWQGTVEENIAEKVATVYNMRDGDYEGKDDEYTEFGR